MSDFQIDNIEDINDFATMIATLLGVYFGANPSDQSQSGTSGGSTSGGGPSGSPGQLIDDVLMPDPNKLLPNIGQLTDAGDLSQFGDAIDLFGSYDKARRELVGNPGEYLTSPTSSSLGALFDGLNHLYWTAIAIYKNYDAAGHDDKLSADQIKTMLDAPPPSQQTPSPPAS